MTLVGTFNEGIHLQRLSGIRSGHGELLEGDRPLARMARSAQTSAQGKGMRARQPDQPASRSATASGSRTRCSATARTTSCSCRRGRSATRAHGRRRCPYLARHFRVVTYDPPGNGKSDRPLDPEQYTDWKRVADAIAVLDATGTERAVIAGICTEAWTATLLADKHPQRCDGLVFFAPVSPYGENMPERESHVFRRRARDARGLGERKPPLLADELPRLPRVLLRPSAVRTALDQTDRRLRRLGARDDAADARSRPSMRPSIWRR